MLPIVIDRKIEYEVPSKDISLTGLPFDGFKVTYIIDYPDCDSIGSEIFSIDFSDLNRLKDKFVKEIAQLELFV